MSVGATGFGNRTRAQPEFGENETSYDVGEGPYSGHGDSKYGSGAVSIFVTESSQMTEQMLSKQT